MKKISLLAAILLLSGCASIKPWPDFPDPEESLMKPCVDLKQLPSDSTVTISQLEASVVGNYTLRHLCANKVEGWQLWYKEQRKIYDDAKAKSK